MNPADASPLPEALLSDGARAFLDDPLGLARADSVDRRREERFGDLRGAFRRFRDGDLELPALADALEAALAATADGRADGENLWGLENDDERRFVSRLAAAAGRRADLDLAAVVRSFLEDRPEEDAERIQQLLAFGELIAGLDAGGDAAARLGVGPAACFLTLAWHCLSNGRDPVFSYGANRAVRALAKGGVLADPDAGKGDLEQRFTTFFGVCRGLEGALVEGPATLRMGWAIGHALTWMRRQLRASGAASSPDAPWRASQQRAAEAAAQPSIAPAATPTIQPAQPEPAPDPPWAVEPPGTGLAVEESLGARDGRAVGAADAAAAAAGPAGDSVAESGSRSRFLDVARARVIQDSNANTDYPSGIHLIDALPPDRSADDRPFFVPAPSSVRAQEPRPQAADDFEARAETRPATAPVDAGGSATPEVRPPGEQAAGRAAVPPAPSTDAFRVGGSDDAAVPLDALLREFRGEVVQASRGGEEQLRESARLAQGLYLDPDHWEEIVAAIEQRRAVLLVGPPACGKTYVARRLAIHLAGHEERVLLVRLHPSIGYDDLVDGPRGPGLVRALCERAGEDRERRYVLVLDELDRGDAASALGELVAAFGERGQPVRLARSHVRFVVPRNVQVIATARELPHDPALQGRFPVVEHPADAEVLRRFLRDRHPALEWAADLLGALTERLARDGHDLRIGHGLFMTNQLDVARLRGIWRREVIPLIAAQGIDPGPYRYDALRAAD